MTVTVAVPSVTCRVTVWPASTPLVVPVIGAAPTLPPFTSSRLTVIAAVVSSAAVSVAVAGLPAVSLTEAVTVSGPSARPDRSAVVL